MKVLDWFDKNQKQVITVLMVMTLGFILAQVAPATGRLVEEKWAEFQELKSVRSATSLKVEANNRVVTDCVVEAKKDACDFIKEVQANSRM